MNSPRLFAVYGLLRERASHNGATPEQLRQALAAATRELAGGRSAAVALMVGYRRLPALRAPTGLAS